jgi:hypothetical protein
MTLEEGDPFFGLFNFLKKFKKKQLKKLNFNKFWEWKGSFLANSRKKVKKKFVLIYNTYVFQNKRFFIFRKGKFVYIF